MGGKEMEDRLWREKVNEKFDSLFIMFYFCYFRYLSFIVAINSVYSTLLLESSFIYL